MGGNLKWLLEDDLNGSDAVGAVEFVRSIVQDTAEDEYVVPDNDKDAQAKLSGLVDFTTLGRLSALPTKTNLLLVNASTPLSISLSVLFCISLKQDWTASV